METHVEPMKMRFEVCPLLVKWVENNNTTYANPSLQHSYNMINLFNSIQLHKLLFNWQIFLFIVVMHLHISKKFMISKP
jgi:hypothetical protein